MDSHVVGLKVRFVEFKQRFIIWINTITANTTDNVTTDDTANKPGHVTRLRLRELNVLQLKKTHVNTPNTSKLRKLLNQFNNMRCTQPTNAQQAAQHRSRISFQGTRSAEPGWDVLVVETVCDIWMYLFFSCHIMVLTLSSEESPVSSLSVQGQELIRLLPLPAACVTPLVFFVRCLTRLCCESVFQMLN